MEKINFRKASKQDAEQYIALRNKVWRVAYQNIFPEQVFLEKEAKAEKEIANFEEYYYNDNTKITYVAEIDGKVVGILMGVMQSEYEYFSSLGYADLQALYVYPEYQGMGIAGNLKKIFEAWAKQNGANKYVIGVLKENAKARKVYEKWGGELSNHTQPFVKLGVGYEEVFYTYSL